MTYHAAIFLHFSARRRSLFAACGLPSHVRSVAFCIGRSHTRRWQARPRPRVCASGISPLTRLNECIYGSRSSEHTHVFLCALLRAYAPIIHSRRAKSNTLRNKKEKSLISSNPIDIGLFFRDVKIRRPSTYKMADFACFSSLKRATVLIVKLSVPA